MGQKRTALGNRLRVARIKAGFDKQKELLEYIAETIEEGSDIREIKSERISDAERGTSIKWQKALKEYFVEYHGFEESFFDINEPESNEERIKQLEKDLNEIKSAMRRFFRDMSDII